MTDSGPVSSVVDDLRAALSKLECRVAVLEKSPAAVTAAPAPSVPYTNVRLYTTFSPNQSCFSLTVAPTHHRRLLCEHVVIFTLFRAPLSSRRPAPRLKRRRRRKGMMMMMTLTCSAVMKMKRQRNSKSRG